MEAKVSKKSKAVKEGYDKITFTGFQLATGRWYGIIRRGDDYLIERVLGWIAEICDGQQSGVTPVAPWGVRMEWLGDGDHRIHCVAGDDKASDGRTWADVFNDPPAMLDGQKCITTLMPRDDD
jgi:hypothetical protein